MADEKKIPEIPKKKGTVDKMPKTETKIVGEKAPKVKAPKSGTAYVLLKNFDPAGGTKMPLQSQQILTILANAENQTLEKSILLAKMKDIVVTRQPIERILAFYQPRLISGNYFKMIPVIAEVKADAPANTEAPAA